MRRIEYEGKLGERRVEEGRGVKEKGIQVDKGNRIKEKNKIEMKQKCNINMYSTYRRTTHLQWYDTL